MDGKYPWHRLTPCYSAESKSRHGPPIMGKQDSSLFCGPAQNLPVIGLPQAHVLYADQVDGRQAPQQAAYDVVVKVLVTQQPEQPNRPWLVS